MSVVACVVKKNKIIIGSDSQSTLGTRAEKREWCKLFETDYMVVGYSGYVNEYSFFRVFCETHKPKSATEIGVIDFLAEFTGWVKDKTDEINVRGSYFIVFKEEFKVFRVVYLAIDEIKDFAAIGSGADFALAALHLGSLLRKAIKVACELNIYCSEPISIIEVKKNENI